MCGSSPCLCPLSSGLACLIAADMVLRHRAEAAVSEAGVSMEEISDWLSSMWHGAVYPSLIGGVRCISIGCPKMDDEIEKVLQLLEVSL